ncbi:hypothetical protein [Herbiconiux liukaitaii]|uniref:hypothetical protein n=1 Tax=Herbiconiux liukaitaii TaxID=3342799 RepID=UPI0035B95442
MDDRVKWWMAFVTDELGALADVVYEASEERDHIAPGETGVPAVVTITPHRAEAMSLTVIGGGFEVPTLRLGDIAEIECSGVPSEEGTASLDPSNQAGVMIAAVVSDGAALYEGRLRRRLLVLGPPERHRVLERMTRVATWPPYSDHYDQLSLFRRPPDYEQLPREAFLLHAAR